MPVRKRSSAGCRKCDIFSLEILGFLVQHQPDRSRPHHRAAPLAYIERLLHCSAFLHIVFLSGSLCCNELLRQSAHACFARCALRLQAVIRIDCRKWMGITDSGLLRCIPVQIGQIQKNLGVRIRGPASAKPDSLGQPVHPEQNHLRVIADKSLLIRPELRLYDSLTPIVLNDLRQLHKLHGKTERISKCASHDAAHKYIVVTSCRIQHFIPLSRILCRVIANKFFSDLAEFSQIVSACFILFQASCCFPPIRRQIPHAARGSIVR